MLFGTIYRLRPKPGQEGAVEEHLRAWERERMPMVEGVVTGYVARLRNRPGELMGVAIFDSEAHYRQNAEDPAQDRWYRALRAMLEADPEWNDADFIAVGEGRS